MNTRSRFTISTALGFALVGGVVGSAQAQTKQVKKMHSDMAYGKEMADDDMTNEWEMRQPAPIGYPFSAPGGLHLYHYTDYSGEGIAEGSATMKRMNNMEMRDKMMHEREMMRKDKMMTDEQMMMNGMNPVPAPIGYPFSAPGGLHLYHYTDYSGEGIAEGSATMKRMNNMEMRDKMMHEREMMHKDHMMGDEGMMGEWGMPEPAPIGYPFAAPGGLHLYHYTDYTHESMAEGSSSMKKMDNAEKMDKKRMKRMKQN